MTKNEIKKASNTDLTRETISTYAHLLQNYMAKGGTKVLERHFGDCCNEMVARGLLTKEDVDKLNY